MNACKHLAPSALCRGPPHELRWPQSTSIRPNTMGRGTQGKSRVNCTFNKKTRMALWKQIGRVSWLWVGWALLSPQPQAVIMRSPQCMSFGDEWIIYLGGFTTNLPFLLSKSNHNGIHIGLMHWYDDFKGWTEGGEFTEWPGEYLQGFAGDMIQQQQDQMLFCGV